MTSLISPTKATAIYGTRGSSGVIIITTKKGAKGAFGVEYNTSVSFDKIAKSVEIATPERFVEEGGPDLGTKTDWLDLVMSGAWVECQLENEMKYPASLNFYPDFKERAITQMHAAVYYNSDVTFKDHPFVRDSLLHDAMRLMDRWYGPGFTKIHSPDSLKDDIFVKVNGNRRITVYTDDVNTVINLWFVDLTKEK